MASARTDVYASVTERIIEQLEAGIVPWRQPWKSHGAPYNILNGREYHGINLLLLTLDGYADPRWGTFNAIREAAVKQAVSEGREIVVEKRKGRGGYDKTLYWEIVNGERKWFAGGVRKGERGTHIVLWKIVKKTGRDDAGNETDDSYRFMRYFVVFNAQQADGLPELELDRRDFTPIEAAQRIVDGYVNHPGPAVLYGKSQAAYSPSKDLLYMPDPEDFVADEEFYGTIFHELVHSTGHESRLKRIEPALFGSDPYAREELVAEIGSSFLSGIAGLEIAGGEQSAAYIGGWLERLRGDKRLVVQAAAQAQTAADLIIGETPEACEAEACEEEAVAA